MIITIDGPAGSGKSTVSAQLAEKLRFLHLNSGLLYRAIARAAKENAISYENESGLVSLARAAEFDFNLDPSDFRTRVELKFPALGDYSLHADDLHAEEWSRGASVIGTLPDLRAALSAAQRKLGESFSMVLEGRDAGSVVFPNADFKFYLETSLEERVRRRLLQHSSLSDGKSLHPKELEALKEQVKKDMLERDRRDSSREASPTVIPEDAVLIKTDGLSVLEVVDKVFSLVRS